MESILKALNELAGVNATVIFDVGGTVVARGGHAIYDETLLGQVADTLVKALDSIQLQHSDWDAITAQFADGKILLRNLGSVGGKSYSLAVVSDATLNASFAAVAMRVAATKLKKVLEGGVPPATAPASALRAAPGSTSAQSSGMTRAVSPPPPPPAAAAPSASSPVLANSGITWSQVGSSGMGLSSIAVADPPSSAYLTRCAKELARFVGPMSKVFVKESVRRVCPGVPFSLASAHQLAADLESHVEDPADKAVFRRALERALT